MKVYNKFVESKKEPQNKNDIWFDGEYINLYKEGEWKAFTVPFNALDKSMEIPRLGEFVKRITKDDLGTSFEVKYASKLIFVINDKIKVLKVGETIHLESYGPSSALDLSLEAYGSSVILTISNMSNVDMLSGYTIDIYKTIIKLRKEFLPDDIGGADWNAQEGEAGFIKNRTHYHGNTVKFKYNEYYDRYETDYVPSDEGPIYIEDVFERGWNRKYEIPSIEYSEDGQSEYDWSNALTIKFWDVSEEYYGEFKVGYDIDSSIVVAIYNANEADVDYDYRIKNMNIFTVVRIESEFIPDTVIKTTPQTLSTNDKNRALANLGIDPVVWKYICNPYTIIPSTEIPIDLHNIIYDATNEKLKSSIINFANIKPFSDNAQLNGIYSFYKVDSNAIYINVSEEGVYKYQYNPQTRKFEEYS